MQKLKKIYIYIITVIAFIGIVSASEFTGNFNDTGIDTGLDGMYNFLVINAGLSINKNSYHNVYAQLKDSSNNIHEFSSCTYYTAGTHFVNLTFDGLKIYNKKVNGPYTLSYVELSSGSDCSNVQGFSFEDSLTDAYVTQYYDYTEFQRGDPAVICNVSPCIADESLIMSRDNLDTPEPNSPNTIDGCEDGSFGTYQDSESIEKITVTSQNNSFFRKNDQVQVDVKVYCDDANDRLNIIYSNAIEDIGWRIMDSVACGSTGLKTLSGNFMLDDIVGKHAIRSVFSYYLDEAATCGMYGGALASYWADTDDVVIIVKECINSLDCGYTDCDTNDGCYSGTYRDYDDALAACLPDNTCQENSCQAYTEISTDSDNDTYDSECDNDCDDNNADINPGVDEVCDNNIDDDCDTKIDDKDPDCSGQTINLNQGWNLISMPSLKNTSVAAVLEIFGNDLLQVVTFKEGNWQIYDMNNQAESNLETINPEDSFWVNMENPSNFKILNNIPGITYDIKQGLNFISYPSTEYKGATQVFSEVDDDIEVAYIYTGNFNYYHPQLSNNFLISPGMGFIIIANKDAAWSFNTKFQKGSPSITIPTDNSWNLVSLPLESTSTVNDIFGDTKLYYLDNNIWKTLESADSIDYRHSYWYNSDGSDLTIEGSEITDINIPLIIGWNTINNPSTTDTTIDALFSDIKSSLDIVYVYDNGVWKYYSPSLPETMNTLTTIPAGKGLLVKSGSAMTLDFDGEKFIIT